jgi:OmpA-OmpF porin, OOP family
MIKQHLAWVAAAAIAWNTAYANDTTAPAAVVAKSETPAIAKSETAAVEPSSRISWQTFQATPLSQANPGNHQARIVFLRPGPVQPTATPADVFVNGRFHSAVLPGAYAEVVVCSGSHQIELQSRATAGIDPAKPPSLTVQVKPQQTAYVAVNDPRVNPPLRTLAANALPPEIGQLQRQNHAVSRVPAAKDCKPQETRYNLASELLFQFGKSDVQDLLSTGETEIIRLARKIRQEHASIEAVQVIGHTDPMGAKDLNLRLSQNRAETVRNILVAAGLPAERVTAKGMGDSQLVVFDCASKRLSRAEMLGCNQPNRRVEVLVRGIQD